MTDPVCASTMTNAPPALSSATLASSPHVPPVPAVASPQLDLPASDFLISPAEPISPTTKPVQHAFSLGVSVENNAIHRRRRDVRAARDRLGEQFDRLRRVLPTPPPGVELNVKAQVLEHSLDVIQSLMKRATALAMELAVVNPHATKNWVRNVADNGRKPLLESVVTVMKLFAAKRRWSYAEWWTLDERQNSDQSEEEAAGNGVESDDDKPAGVVDDPNNVHGCVVRDTASVMRLNWTLINRSVDDAVSQDEDENENDENEKLASFARASKSFEFRPRRGMPGRVWTSRRAEWLINLEDRETFIRHPLAKEFGMKTCLAVPIQFGGHVHSVMAFYTRKITPYDPECYDLATLLSTALGEAYSPHDSGPWQLSSDSFFPSPHR